jgi:hypothetical protein
MSTQTAIPANEDSRVVSPTEPFLRRVLPIVLMALAIGLTVGWTGFLGYAFVLLVERAT